MGFTNIYAKLLIVGFLLCGVSHAQTNKTTIPGKLRILVVPNPVAAGDSVLTIDTSGNVKKTFGLFINNSSEFQTGSFNISGLGQSRGGYSIGSFTNGMDSHYRVKRKINNDTTATISLGASILHGSGWFLGVWLNSDSTHALGVRVNPLLMYPEYYWNTGTNADPIVVLNPTNCIGCTFDPTNHQITTSVGSTFTTTAASQTTFTVTIGTTQANTAYKVEVTPGTSVSTAAHYVTNKTTTTFDVVYLSAVTGSIQFDWEIFK